MQWMVNAQWRFRVRAIYYSWRPGIKTCCSNGGETCGLHSPHLGCGATDTHQHLSQPLFILVGSACWLWLACFLHSAITVNTVTHFIIWLYLSVCRGRGKGGDNTWFSLVWYHWFSITNANILAIVNGFFAILNLILAQSVASPLSKHCYCICYSTKWNCLKVARYADC